MKKLLLLITLLAVIAIPVQAQIASQTTGNGVPMGACPTGFATYRDILTGRLWECVTSAWSVTAITIPGALTGIDLTNQTAIITSTLLYAVPAGAGGLYRISYVAKVTTVASTSSVLGGVRGFRINYTDADDSTVSTQSPSGPTSTDNALVTQVNSVIIVNAKAGTNINYSFQYTSVGATPMAYALHVKIEALV